jgi:hypothetical protein
MNDGNMHSAFAMSDKILASKELIEKVREDPAKELPKVAKQVVDEQKSALVTDRWIYRIVVISLGGTILLVVLGAILLAVLNNQDVKIPEILTAIGSAAVGALAGLLAPAPGKSA